MTDQKDNFSIADGTARMVPEIIVHNIGESRKFWIGLLKFGVVFDRPAFSYSYRQFLVQDPDGYLIRFARKIGRRAVASAPAA